jgi:lysozyme family protein
MKTVRQISIEILRREGGFVNDPDDLGGATNFGVTLGKMRDLGLDLDRNGIVDASDVKLLTMEEALEIYEREYYSRANIHLLPEALRATVYDMQINAGANAGKILQRLLVEVGEPVAVDGAIGRATAAAAARAWSKMGAALVEAYGIARRNYYYALGDTRPASRKFARRRDGGKGGWITRAEEFISPRFHLSEIAHRKRVVKWEL